jgi:hypothetical protein
VRGFSAVLICAAAVVISGCGTGGETDESTVSGASEAKMRPADCGPADMEAVLTGFIDAVNAGDQVATARYVAPQPELHSLSLSLGRGADAKTIEVRAPAGAYAAMRTLTQGERFKLLFAGVGVAPRQELRAGPHADDPAAGVDFTYVSQKRSISGKVGVNCATGQIYLGPMVAERGKPRGPKTVCGRSLSRAPSKPIVCAYEY